MLLEAYFIAEYAEETRPELTWAHKLCQRVTGLPSAKIAQGGIETEGRIVDDCLIHRPPWLPRC